MSAAPRRIGYRDIATIVVLSQGQSILQCTFPNGGDVGTLVRLPAIDPQAFLIKASNDRGVRTGANDSRDAAPCGLNRAAAVEG